MVRIFTDGSCLGNPGPGGWGVIIRTPDDEIVKLTGSENFTTNNQMELTAALQALKWLKSHNKYKQAQIWTDSNYLKDGITKWIFSWKKNGWKNSKKEPVKNKDLWVEIDSYNSLLDINWNWVKAHNGHPENEAVDKLAYNSAMHALSQEKN